MPQPARRPGNLSVQCSLWRALYKLPLMQLERTYGWIQLGWEVLLLLAPAGNKEGGSQRKNRPWSPELANYNFNLRNHPT